MPTARVTSTERVRARNNNRDVCYGCYLDYYNHPEVHDLPLNYSCFRVVDIKKGKCDKYTATGDDPMMGKVTK